LSEVILRKLNKNDEAAFLAGAKAWEGEDPHWYSFNWKPGGSFSEMFAKLEDEDAGRNLQPGRVPHTMLYGFIDGEIIGRVSVRHTLNESLRKRGGHIGYAVAPKYRGKGYATEMVRQALSFCKSLGLTSIMVTCADDNAPSWKVIEKFGGVLQDKVWDDEDEEAIRRYWITF
jgi:predicted acetyltransferase